MQSKHGKTLLGRFENDSPMSSNKSPKEAPSISEKLIQKKMKNDDRQMLYVYQVI